MSDKKTGGGKHKEDEASRLKKSIENAKAELRKSKGRAPGARLANLREQFGALFGAEAAEYLLDTPDGPGTYEDIFLQHATGQALGLDFLAINPKTTDGRSFAWELRGDPGWDTWDVPNCDCQPYVAFIKGEFDPLAFLNDWERRIGLRFAAGGEINAVLDLPEKYIHHRDNPRALKSRLSRKMSPEDALVSLEESGRIRAFREWIEGAFRELVEFDEVLNPSAKEYDAENPSSETRPSNDKPPLSLPLGKRWPDLLFEVDSGNQRVRVSDQKDDDSFGLIIENRMGLTPTLWRVLEALAKGAGNVRGIASAPDTPLSESFRKNQSNLTKRLSDIFPHIQGVAIERGKANFHCAEWHEKVDQENDELKQLIDEQRRDMRSD